MLTNNERVAINQAILAMDSNPEREEAIMHLQRLLNRTENKIPPYILAAEKAGKQSLQINTGLNKMGVEFARRYQLTISTIDDCVFVSLHSNELTPNGYQRGQSHRVVYTMYELDVDVCRVHETIESLMAELILTDDTTLPLHYHANLRKLIHK